MTEPARGRAGRLFLVATPIGNLEDVTLRALRVLKEADVIAAEDTRRTLRLLTHYQIRVPLVSYYKDIEARRAAELLARLVAGERVAVVTDAGTPGISDPGERLVRLAREQGVAVEVIPGPSALLAALTGSGLPAQDFSFHGFLEAKPQARQRQLAELRDRGETQVFFVAPHRLKAVLSDLATAWGERDAVLCRELTKLHEEYLAGTLTSLAAAQDRGEPRGEYTLVVAGSREERASAQESLVEQLERLQAEGLSLNQAVRRAARERGLETQAIYAWAHARKAKHRD